MRKTITSLAFLAMSAALMTLYGQSNGKSLRANLTTYQEVPAVATTATGSFNAKINDAGTAVEFELAYKGVQGGNATMAHIHLGTRRTNGGVVAFFCGGRGQDGLPRHGGYGKGHHHGRKHSGAGRAGRGRRGHRQGDSRDAGRGNVCERAFHGVCRRRVARADQRSRTRQRER
ncbi:MAG: CHRD domain-containing protein [Acidobacteria bacterium]|nr:CHRD domain-containing protein [Acidobacteriota bacterium]